MKKLFKSRGDKKKQPIDELKAFLDADPSMAETVKFVAEPSRGLTLPKTSQDVLDLLLKKFPKEQSKELIGQLIWDHWEKVRDTPGEFLRGDSLYKTAMMQHYNALVDEKHVDQYLKDPNKYLRGVRVPRHLQEVLKKVVDIQQEKEIPLTQLAHNIYFAMVFGPVQNYLNKEVFALQQQSYDARDQAKNVEDEKLKSDAQERLESLQSQIEKLKGKSDRVAFTNQVFTESSRMLSQAATEKNQAPDSSGQKQGLAQQEKVPARTKEVATQLNKSGLGITPAHLTNYVSLQQSLLASVSKNVKEGQLLQQTESIRQVFEKLSEDQSKRHGVMLDKKGKRGLQQRIDVLPKGWERTSPREEAGLGRLENEIKALEAKKENIQGQKQDLAERKKALLLARFGKTDEEPKVSRRASKAGPTKT